MFDFSEAACLDADPELFFSDEEYVYDKKKTAAAKLICRGCPIKDACFQYAVDGRYQGIWGGLTDAERTRKVNGVNLTPEVRAMRGEVLRKHNKRKQMATSAKYIADLKKALESRTGEIDPETLELVHIRINNPELSMSEVGARCSTPVTRYAVAGRFRRLLQDEEERQKEKARVR
jgi:WhiB family redox-sensing transcriptional regulator